MIAAATERAEMPEGTSEVLDRRTLQKDYATLIPILKKGLRVLDVGCGTGAITKGIANIVGNTGFVIGIDNSAHLIKKGKEALKDVNHAALIEADLFEYIPEEKFDLIVSARVLQWLSNPKEALIKLKELLKPGGQISILDYNHKEIEWKPEPPASMKKFYQAFLNWREEAGMDSETAKHLPAYFGELGFHSIEIINADEIYQRGELDFAERVGIWMTVAALRGKQMVQAGFITEAERLQAMEEYDIWSKTRAEKMILKLKEVRAKI